MDSLKKLLNYHRGIKPFKCPKYDLVVIRVSKTGKLGSSRPCFHCLSSLEMACQKYNFMIGNVFYSTTDGNIIKEHFADMRNSEKTYVSSGNRKKK